MVFYINNFQGNFYGKTDYVAQPIHVVNRNKVNN